MNLGPFKRHSLTITHTHTTCTVYVFHIASPKLIICTRKIQLLIRRFGSADMGKRVWPNELPPNVAAWSVLWPCGSWIIRMRTEFMRWFRQCQCSVIHRHRMAITTVVKFSRALCIPMCIKYAFVQLCIPLPLHRNECVCVCVWFKYERKWELVASRDDLWHGWNPAMWTDARIHDWMP